MPSTNLAFTCQQQVQQIPEHHEAGFRVYVIDTAKHTDIKALIHSYGECQYNFTALLFSKMNYRHGHVFEGFSFFLPMLITQDSDAPLPLFLIQLDL